MPFLRDEPQHVVAARRIVRAGLRVLLFAYLTGAVLLLPGFVKPLPTREAAMGAPRVAAIARTDEHATLLAAPAPTVDRAEPLLSRTHVTQPGESLDAIAREFGVRAETIAYNNGLRARTDLRAGATIRIPSGDGALYVVKAGDGVESVAARFQTDAQAILEANRLYFEPDNFAEGKTVLVPTSHFPDFEWDAAVARAGPAARGAPPASISAPMQNRLQWPVAGTISQIFSPSHAGVDLVAPYGAAIGASDAGVVSAVGWVAVGGLRVCVKHDWGMETCYYHTSAVYAAVGQRVARGQVIAAIGLTGVTTGPHVHWEANLGGVLVNPFAY